MVYLPSSRAVSEQLDGSVSVSVIFLSLVRSLQETHIDVDQEHLTAYIGGP